MEQEPFTTVGASGVDFIPEPAALAEEDRRDFLLLGGLRDALDALASPAYAAAFAGSTNQDDYRWGKLSRVVIEHPLGGASSIPPAAGFEDLAPGLPGLAHDSTWDAVNALYPFGVPAGANDRVSSFGPIWRHVHSPLRASASGSGTLGFAALAGGASGDPASPLYASQLGEWLTVDYHRVPLSRRDVRMVAERVELFTPPRP